jgi:hypothetical protein
VNKIVVGYKNNFGIKYFLGNNKKGILHYSKVSVMEEFFMVKLISFYYYANRLRMLVGIDL